MFWLVPRARNEIGTPKVLLTSAPVFAVLETIYLTVKEFTETAVPTI